MKTTYPIPFFANKYAIGILFAILGALGFSTKAVFIKLSYHYGANVITVLTLRMIFSTPFYLYVLFKEGWKDSNEKNNFKDLLGVISLGILGYYVASLLDFEGLQYISVGLERLILYLYPTFVLILSVWFLSEKLKIKAVYALLISYAGIFIVFLYEPKFSKGLSEISLGALLIFLSALAYAIYLMGSQLYMKKINSITFTAYAMLAAAGASIIQFFFTNPVRVLFNQSIEIYMLTIVMAIFSTVLPSFLISAAIQRIGSGKTALIGATGPICTLFLGAIVLGESLGFIQLLGSCLILVGVFLIRK